MARGPQHDSADRHGNWGRWGDDDQLGALNLVSPEMIVAAATLVRRGVAYPLGLEISTRRSMAHPSRPRPLHFMSLDGGDFAAGVHLPGGSQYAEDVVMLPCHGPTHIDALSHYWADDTLYNGFSADRVRSYGATRCGIEHVGGIVARGVLLDLPSHLGLPHLPAGHCISVEEVEALLGDLELEIGTGDCVLVRTGWQQLFDHDPDTYHAHAPGIGLDVARWLVERDVCLVGADTAGVEVHRADGRYDGGTDAPSVHPLLIRDHGVYLLELLALDDLARDKVSEFLFIVAPLRIAGGTGSPVNPIAVA